MKPIYEEITTDNGNIVIKKTDVDGMEYWIPPVETNSDYQAYLNRDNPDYGKLV
jgi:hypothetical protein